MVTIQIASVSRSLDEVDESWIAQQVNGRGDVPWSGVNRS